MKRLIKFRGKRTDTGEWVFGDLIHGVGSKHGRMYILPITHIYPKGCNELDGWEVLPDTIGQFTGLLDKNDKEIYEGDSISVNGRLIGYIIDGVRAYCYDVIYTPPLENGEKSWSLYGIVVVDYPNKTEITGNIHDNPELQKGGSDA